MNVITTHRRAWPVRLAYWAWDTLAAFYGGLWDDAGERK